MFTGIFHDQSTRDGGFSVFTEEEVHALCATYKRNFEEAQAWYDGYELCRNGRRKPQIYSMYSPKSVVDAMLSGLYDNYWNRGNI